MGVRDFEAYIRQRAVQFDSNLDVSPGSPFDVQVIQPILRRLGPDPFSVDLSTFIASRLKQAFPDMANSEGDAIVDLLNKPATLLWDPIVREIVRVQRSQSFRDATVLTTEEADALGANLFAERRTGQFARGVARIFFAAPQNISVSPINFVTSKTGLHFFPTEIQSIRTEEMLLNLNDDGLYYFDINVIANEAGTRYNIEANSLVSIANLPAAVRVTNIRRFRQGENEDTAVDFIDRAKQELTERSLVTLRGIGAKLTKAFPELQRLNVVGYGDPEMQRDVLTGGGLGEILAAGVAGQTVADGKNATRTTRFFSSEVDFTTVIGAASTVPSGYVLTVFGAVTGDVATDLDVTRVVGATEIEVADSVLNYNLTDLRWMLRKRELTLSDIPGGILFPDSPQGTVTIPDGEVHVGGMSDIHIRAADFDEATLVLDSVVDDQPEASGSQLKILGSGFVELHDYFLDVNYVTGDSLYELFARAATEGLTLEILHGVDAGAYRVVAVGQGSATPVSFTLDPHPTNPGASFYRWKLLDELHIDLVNPRETRVSGSDLIIVQNSDTVTTSSGIDFDELGVAKDDVLRIEDGPDAGDYALVEDPLAPGFTQLRIDTALTSSQTGVSFNVYRPNQAGGLQRPLVRIKKVELLDSSKQPAGSIIPYAKPVDVQSRTFQNPARGVKLDILDAELGIVSIEATGGNYTVPAGGKLRFNIDGTGVVTVTLTGGVMPVATVISEINAAIELATGYVQAAIAIGTNRFGIRPFNPRGGVSVQGGSPSAMVALFGTDQVRTTSDIRSDTIDATTLGWIASSTPALDLDTGLDVIQVIDGHQIGFYSAPYTVEHILGGTTPTEALILGAYSGVTYTLTNYTPLAPEVGVHLQIGARSIGSARCYFIEPTSIEFDQDSRFSVELPVGTVRFLPDPTLEHQKLPALPSATPLVDGESADGGSVLTSTSQDFVLSGVKVGDTLEILEFEIEATEVLADPVPNLVNKTLTFSIDSGPDRTLTFIRDDLSIPSTDVTRDGVVDQINAAAGVDIVELTGSNTLRFKATVPIAIRGTGTANSLILGDVAGTSPLQSFSASTGQHNRSPHFGRYTITGVTATTLTVSSTFADVENVHPSPVTNQSFKVLRSGVQRITATQMAQNQAEAGLYYFDVELVSEGTGDLWNIEAGQQLSASDYRSDGYYLTTEDSNLTFSVLEQPHLVISKSILEEGVDDDPTNATQISGSNIQITYDRSTLTEDVQDFVSSEVERVVCSNPLSRHLVPHFVRFDVSYVGGSREEVVLPDIESYIRRLSPIEELESSDVQAIVSNRGATSISNPIDLLAIVHNVDRSVQAQRSQDSLSTTRLAAFVPDLITLKRGSV